MSKDRVKGSQREKKGQQCNLLFEKGYRNVALVGTGQNISNHVMREKGFLATCAKLGMSAKLWTGEPKGGQRLLRLQADKGNPPVRRRARGGSTAQTSLPWEASGPAGSWGVSLPGAIGMMGYGSPHFNEYLTPSLSSVGFPISNMIQDCVNLLLDKYYNNSQECKSIRFQADFTFRESFRPD